MSDTVYRQQLQQACKRGERFAYLCFWGHTPKLAGSVDKSCLSQWYPAAFEVGEHCYATAEHYMMAQKALLFGDEAVFERISRPPIPKKPKPWGGKCGITKQMFGKHSALTQSKPPTWPNSPNMPIYGHFYWQQVNKYW